MSEFAVVHNFMLSNRNKISKVSNNRISKIDTHPHSLRKWINIFFIAFTSGVMVIAVGLVFYTSSYEFSNFLTDEHSDLIKIVSVTQKVILALASVVIVGLALLWFYLQRFILLPLNHMRKSAEHIIHGKLDQAVKITAPIEIELLSETINDLSVNMQEILLFVWNQTENSLRCIEEDTYENPNADMPTNGLDTIKNNLLELQQMISSFTLYDVHMNRKRVFGKSDSD